MAGQETFYQRARSRKFANRARAISTKLARMRMRVGVMGAYGEKAEKLRLGMRTPHPARRAGAGRATRARHPELLARRRGPTDDQLTAAGRPGKEPLGGCCRLAARQAENPAPIGLKACAREPLRAALNAERRSSFLFRN
jgi:hypothetical protein